MTQPRAEMSRRRLDRSRYVRPGDPTQRLRCSTGEVGMGELQGTACPPLSGRPVGEGPCDERYRLGRRFRHGHPNGDEFSPCGLGCRLAPGVPALGCPCMPCNDVVRVCGRLRARKACSCTRAFRPGGVRTEARTQTLPGEGLSQNAQPACVAGLAKSHVLHMAILMSLIGRPRPKPQGRRPPLPKS